VLNKIQERLKAFKMWFHDMFVFWAPLERSHYTVECPEGHQTVLTREEVIALDFAEGQLAMIEWGFTNEKTINIRYTQCPHEACQEAAHRHEFMYA
jgi:hypothetical protein